MTVTEAHVAAAVAATAGMNGDQILAHYNALVREAVAEGVQGVRENKSRFHDHPLAMRKVAIIMDELRARRAGMAAVDKEGTSLQDTSVGDMTPGRARLKNSGREDDIRSQVVADQEAAAEGVAREPKKGRKIVAKKAAKAKAKAKKAPKTNGATTERAPRRAWYNPEATITVLAEGNPRREGGRGHAAWACYRSGMKVQTFLDRVAEALKTTVADAATHLKWDLEREHVKVVG